MERFYKGLIQPEPDTIFVFGSNPEGRHGAGSAVVAKKYWGAEYGVGEGLCGMSYALPTTDLRTWKRPSMDKDVIINNIRKMYATAENHPEWKFKVAYTNKAEERTLCGYSGRELMDMFIEAGPAPENVMFSDVWGSDEIFVNSFKF